MDDTGSRSSAGSARSSHSARRAQNPQQQLSQIEKSVTHLLVATKQLLETLTLWSRGTASEGDVSDVYVRLGYEFNIACRAFNAIGVETSDLGNVPELLRAILEETLSQEASQSSLDNFLPRIRDIIISLLHGLKRKQARLRQRAGRDGTGTNGNRAGSTGSAEGQPGEEVPQRTQSDRPRIQRHPSNEIDTPDLPPRTSSVPGRASPSKYETLPATPRPNRNGTPSRDTVASTDSSMSSNTMQNMPVIAPYPEQDTIPAVETHPPPYAENFPPPPPPPPKQDALAALQRGGELERRASRRFSAYQIQKHLGTGANGVPVLPPTQNSPIPNRGRDVRESMNAVRTRGSLMHSRQPSKQSIKTDVSPNRQLPQRISEEPTAKSDSAPEIKPPPEPAVDDSPVQKTPTDMYRQEPEYKPADIRATLAGPLDGPDGMPITPDEKTPTLSQPEPAPPTRSPSRKAKQPSPPQSQQFVPEDSPQPGKELTLFLQYKSKIKKFVLADGYNDLSMARLQLAFIEKFSWNTHNDGVDLPEIYIQDPVSGVRHELEDLNDIKDRSVLALDVEALDEVKRHFDDGISGLRRAIEGIKTSVEEQGSSLTRLQQNQQSTAKEIASMAAAPSRPVSMMLSPNAPSSSGVATPTQAKPLSALSADQLTEVQALRRDLAVVRQTYTSFVSDIESSMATIRTKASTVKESALNVSIPPLEGDTGRSYVNVGKKTLSSDSESIVNRVDDLQDIVEDLRKDVVTRGVRPLPRQLDSVAKDISQATSELKKLKDYIKREKPLWTKIWEQELSNVMEERELLTMQEDLCMDLEDDLSKAEQTFQLVEQATKQQQLDSTPATGAIGGQANLRSTSGRPLKNLPLPDPSTVDPTKAKDGVLGEVRALQPNHESRLEAIERAEKARQRELEERKDGEKFKKELGSFVQEGKLKKQGGFEEVERMRLKREREALGEIWGRIGKDMTPEPPESTAFSDATVRALDGNAEGETNGDAAEASTQGDGGLAAPGELDRTDTTSPASVFVEAREEPPTPSAEDETKPPI